jgi:6-pyruvoyltetrahydropterin/6-carboxytetrahydropterin synthase
MSYRIALAKEDFKFSGSHFTVFGPDRAERLHGHNYYVTVELTVASLDPDLGMAFDFNLIKPMLRAITAGMDEYILLPANSPFVKLEALARSTVVHFSGKRYELPNEDVKVLPLVNITTEELARFIAEELLRKLQGQSLTQLQRISIGVEETRGQATFFELSV